MRSPMPPPCASPRHPAASRSTSIRCSFTPPRGSARLICSMPCRGACASALLAAITARDVLSFKDYFQSVDVLIIDDLQFLQGKSMQQEFYHTFNSLVDS